MDQSKDKRLERRAKNMILSKEIPHSKMEAVRALLKNDGLKPYEKYSAVIQLIKDCPDKKIETAVEPKRAKRSIEVETTRAAKKNISTPTSTQKPKLSQSSTYVNQLHEQFKKHGLFKKRLLISANNILHFWFKKRLIPTRKYFKVIKTIIAHQEKLLVRLPEIMRAIVEDTEIENPKVYNYLRAFRKWMLENPFSNLNVQTASWLGAQRFESELQGYVSYYFGFNLHDAELKEEILLTVENKLRESSELKKHEILETDSNADSSFKQKENLTKEKQIYDYMLTLRSFIVSGKPGEGSVDKQIKSICNLPSLLEFVIASLDALVFSHRTNMPEILARFDCKALEVDYSRWECSAELLKKAGKDPESRKKQRLESLRAELQPFDEIVEFINTKYDGKDLLVRGFDDHWHIINKRRQEYGNYPEDNFFFYLDDCVDYFFHAFVPFIDGSSKIFVDAHKGTFESAVFSPGYFEGKLTTLSDLQRDLLNFRTNNPNSLISFDEVQRIMSGKLATMNHIRSYISHIGSLFYLFGSELHFIYRAHIRWLLSGASPMDAGVSREPMIAGLIEERGEERGTPIPFFDCRVAKQEHMPPIQKLFVGKLVVSDSIREGIFKHMIAFCYQMAYECMDHSLHQLLDRRREIKRRIREIV